MRLLLAPPAWPLMINMRRVALAGTELQQACTATIRTRFAVEVATAQLAAVPQMLIQCLARALTPTGPADHAGQGVTAPANRALRTQARQTAPAALHEAKIHA